MHKTGATRYQKFLKAEKAKTKLKSKKELPKGTNVTKTNFKVKKIVIKEQLKKHGQTEQLSARKLNAKELLSRLNHFNTNSRTDALEGLKELISSYPETLEQNLGQIILGVTPLILNIEKVVRRDAMKVIHVILNNVQQDKIDPFFDIMSTYLRSSMTHIDSRIQEDSLLFLDVLLICTPEKVTKNFHKIVPNFLDMISKLRVDAKPGRTLTVNLGSQITSVKWRTKVIHRLQEFLNKYTEYNQTNNTNQIVIKETNFDPHKSNYPLFSSHNIALCHILDISKNVQDLQEADEGEKFKVYVDTLMPLLFETWLEVCPNTKSDKVIETVISEEAAILLRHVLKVISLLCQLMGHLESKNPNNNLGNVFIQKYKGQFNQYFINSFPYVTNIRCKHGKGDVENQFEDIITDPKLIADNLEICYLFISLNPNINIKKQTEEITSVLTYIEKVFNEKSNEVTCSIVLNILHTLFSNKTNGWTRNLTVLEKLFRKIIEVYFNENTTDTFKQKIFALLCKIALNQNLSHFHKCDVYEMWLKSLPDILLKKSVTVQTVNIIHQFATTNNSTFNSVVKPKLINIIENLPSIKISDYVPGINSYHKLFSLFYWIKAWDNDSLNLLENQLLNNVYKNDYGKFIFDTLRLRSGNIL